MRTNSEKDYPDTLDELLAECEALIDRYDLYTLGLAPEPGEPCNYPNGLENYSGEWPYGVSMVPCQWVTNVFDTHESQVER